MPYRYLKEFITREQEELLLRKTYAAPVPRWTELSNRRLQNWGARMLRENTSTAVAEMLPDWLASVAGDIGKRQCIPVLTDAVVDNAVNCLVNVYEPGQGILPHVDGPAFKPVIATVTLGCHCLLDFYKRRSPDDLDIPSGNLDKPDFSILLKPRSLIVIESDLYTDFLHGIREVDVDTFGHGDILNWADEYGERYDNLISLERTCARVSLTFRIAEKVSKVNLFGKKRF